MREVAVLGVGVTKFGRSPKTNIEMFSEAAIEAINDSNLKPKDIQALLLGNVFGGHSEGQLGLAAYAAAAIGIPNIPATGFEGLCASAGVAFRNAFMWIAAGYYDIALVGGTERLTVMNTSYATRAFTMGIESCYEAPTGMTFPGLFAIITHLYARKYGIPLKELKEQMALVSIKNRRNGTLNPKAHFKKEISVDDVFNSTMIAQPLQLYDCCPFSDGAAAAVLASADIARKLSDKPVYIIGIGQASAGPLPSQKDITVPQARLLSARQAYKMSGLTPADIDICELHDCFSISELIASECLGFYEFGKGGKAVEKGETVIGGKIPINPSGGLIARGHPIGATGVAQVYEIVKQLRGECGARQVEGAKIGMTDTLGGDTCIACNIILKKG